MPQFTPSYDTLYWMYREINKLEKYYKYLYNASGNDASLDSPAFTGVPTAPTASLGTNTTQIATTAFVTAAIAASSVSAANPSATIGLTAVNGSGNTYMRSNAAPALSQAITPTWSGTHKFIKVSGALDPSVIISSSNPQLDLEVSNAAADAKRWNWIGNTTTMTFRTLNDTGVTASSIWTLTRTGNSVSQQDWYISGSSKLKLTSSQFTISTSTSLGGAIFNISRVDATLAVTISATDYIVILTDNTAGSGTIAIPDPTLAATAGRTIIIMNAGSSNFTTDRSFVSTVDPADTTISANESVTLHCQNNTWYQISS